MRNRYERLKKVKQAFKELNKLTYCRFCKKKTKKIINGSGIIRCKICGNKL